MQMHWEASILTRKVPARARENDGRSWEEWNPATPMECRTGIKRLVLSPAALADLTASLERHDASLAAFEAAEARAAEDRETAAREIKVTMSEHFNAHGIEVSARRLAAILAEYVKNGSFYGRNITAWKKAFPAMDQSNLARIVAHSPYCSACKSYAAGD